MLKKDLGLLPRNAHRCGRVDKYLSFGPNVYPKAEHSLRRVLCLHFLGGKRFAVLRRKNTNLKATRYHRGERQGGLCPQKPYIRCERF